jgi:tetratricopeptide (TPR) repeat protein
LAHLFRAYLLSDRPDSVRIALLDSVIATDPDHPLALYLRGKSLIRLGRFREALEDLDRADASAVHTKLEAGRRLARGDALFRLRRFGEALESYRGALSADPSRGLEEYVRDRVERCEWYERNKMPDALFEVRNGEVR